MCFNGFIFAEVALLSIYIVQSLIKAETVPMEIEFNFEACSIQVGWIIFYETQKLA